MHKILILFVCLSVVWGKPDSAAAQTIIRDSEIETYLGGWFAPIFEVNNMQPSQVKIILVQNNDVNAFVAGGSNIFFYTGLIEKTDHPGELIGVMAHELGHISGGHLVRGRAALEQASYESILGTIIGIGTALATGDTAAAGAGSIAGNSVAQRRFLSTARTFESSADQAALTSMERAGMNPEGLETFLKKLSGQELLPSSQQSEYVRSHPLTRDRINTVKASVEKSKNMNANFPEEWINQHARIKAKLMGYINPQNVAWHYDDKDMSIPAEYARTLADFRQNRIEEALKRIDALILREPQNPYFYELKGQMLVDFGRVEEGRKTYEKAITLLPSSGLIRIALAQAQIESAGENKTQVNEAIKNLKRAVQDEPRSPRVHRLLATAYGRQGENALARLHIAEEALLQRKKSYANKQAELALQELPPESAAALRAKDILLQTSRKK